MARVSICPEFVQAIHGSVSSKSKYYFKTINGKIHLCKKPQQSNKPQTSKQQNHLEKFKMAVAMVQKLLAEPMTKAYFQAQWENKDWKKRYHTLRGWLIAEMMR